LLAACAALPFLAASVAAQPERRENTTLRQLPPPRPDALAPRGTAEQALPKPTSPPAGDAAAPDLRAVTEPDGRSCLALLQAIPGNDVAPGDERLTQGDPTCRVSEPVVLKALSFPASGGARIVAFEPPVTLACAMAQAVAAWLAGSVQPLAQGYFRKDLTALRVGGGHECRRRNRASTGPVSEHATGKALDIFAFAAGAGGDAMQVSVEKPAGLTESRFLTAIRQSACGAFRTALGPGADAAHANHLHVDIEERRSPASRFCQ